MASEQVTPSSEIIATFAALLLAGGTAGFFFAWSFSAMPGLSTCDPRHAISAMKQINVAVQNPVFFVFFFGTPLGAGLAAWLWWSEGNMAAAGCLIAAAAVYLLGTFAVTMLINVPMNEALAGRDVPEELDAARSLWVDYSERWTRWNHVRMIFNFIALLLVGAGLWLGGSNLQVSKIPPGREQAELR